jgi:hypothetical protein
VRYLFAILVFASACAVGRVRQPNGVEVTGFAIGHAKVEFCPNTTTTTSTTTTTEPGDIPSTTTSTTLPLLGCAKIEGGALSNNFMETVGLITAMGSTLFLHWPF